MDYVIATIDSEHLAGILDLPVSLQHTKVEVTVKPAAPEVKLNTSDNSAYGIFRRYADPSKIAGEKGAWERAAVEKAEKYAHR